MLTDIYFHSLFIIFYVSYTVQSNTLYIPTQNISLSACRILDRFICTYCCRIPAALLRDLPAGHTQLKLLFPGIHLAPFLHGLAKHSFRFSVQNLPVNPGYKQGRNDYCLKADICLNGHKYK